MLRNKANLKKGSENRKIIVQLKLFLGRKKISKKYQKTK